MIEVKKATGKLSELQKYRIKELENYKMCAYVVYSVQDFEDLKL